MPIYNPNITNSNDGEYVEHNLVHDNSTLPNSAKSYINMKDNLPIQSSDQYVDELQDNKQIELKSLPKDDQERYRRECRAVQHDNLSSFSQFFMSYISPLTSLASTKGSTLTIDDIPSVSSELLNQNAAPQFYKQLQTNFKDSTKINDAMGNKSQSDFLDYELFKEKITNDILIEQQQQDMIDYIVLNNADSVINANNNLCSSTTSTTNPEEYEVNNANLQQNYLQLPDSIIDSHPLVVNYMNNKEEVAKKPTHVPQNPHNPEALLKQHFKPTPTFWALLTTFRRNFTFNIIGEFVYCTILLCQPYLIRRLTRYFNNYELYGETNGYGSFSEGMTLALLLALSSYISCLATLFKMTHQINLATKAISSTLTNIFDKTMRLSPTLVSNNNKANLTPTITQNDENNDEKNNMANPKTNEKGSNHIQNSLNILSQDSFTIYNTSVFMNNLWSGPYCIIVCLFLMWYDIGFLCAFVTTIMSVVLIIYQIGLSKLIIYYKKRLNKATDFRVGYLTSVLNNLRLIKINAWESSFYKKICKIRDVELRYWKLNILLKMLNDVLSYTYPLFITYIVLIIYIRTTDNYSIETIFVIFAYLNCMRSPIQYITQALNETMDLSLSAQRLENHYLLEERPVLETLLSQDFERQHDLYIQYNHSREDNGINLVEDENSTAENSRKSFMNKKLNSTRSPANNLNSNRNSTPHSPEILTFHGTDVYLQQLPLSTKLQASTNQITAPPLPILSNINFSIKESRQQQLIAIVGDNGVGKSTLLKAMLGDMYLTPHYIQNNQNYTLTEEAIYYFNHQVKQQLKECKHKHDNLITSPQQSVFPQMFTNKFRHIIPKHVFSKNIDTLYGYCSQMPWIMTDTIRANIILDKDYDEVYFNQVLDASCLLNDNVLVSNAQGDLTQISYSTVSGGTASRIAFARLLYQAKFGLNVALIDDLFASVDASCANQMFRLGICGLLKQYNVHVIFTLNNHFDFLHTCTSIAILDKVDEKQDLYWKSLYHALSVRVNGTAAAVIPKQLDSVAIQVVNPQNTKNSMKHQKFENEVQLVLPPELQSSYSNTPTLSTAQSVKEQLIELQYKTPSTIVFYGNFQQLLQFHHPIIDNYHFELSNNVQNSGNKPTTSAAMSYDQVKLHAQQKMMLKHYSLNKSMVNTTGTDDQTNPFRQMTPLTSPTPSELNRIVDEQLKQQPSQALTETKKLQSVEEKQNEYKQGINMTKYMKLYLTYMKNATIWPIFILFFSVFIIVTLSSQAFRQLADVYFVNWARDVPSATTVAVSAHSQRYWLELLFVVVMIALLSFIAQVFIFFHFSTNAGYYFHNATIHNILHTTVQYLDTTPIGVLINVVSKDIQVMDQQLSYNMIYVIQQSVLVISIFVMACYISSPLILIFLIPIILCIGYVSRRFYITSIKLRVVESQALTPIYSLYNNVITGITIIDTYNLQPLFRSKFQHLVDNYIKIKTISAQCERRFGYQINTMASIFIFFLTIFVVMAKSWLNPSLSLMSVIFGMRLVGQLQNVLRYQTTSLQALQSLQTLNNVIQNPDNAVLPQEPAWRETAGDVKAYIKSHQPIQYKDYFKRQEMLLLHNHRAVLSGNGKQVIDLSYRHYHSARLSYFPWFGRIEFKHVQVRYRPELPIVCNLNFTINSGSSVGIVAKSGSGKTTLTNALLRLIHYDGQILIDGVDISDLSLFDLRSRLSVITQQPSLFNTTIRNNLDPIAHYTDNEIWYALSIVKMVEKVQSNGGLYSTITNDGGNYSQSEKQLLCIARTLLSQNGTHSTTSPELLQEQVEKSQQNTPMSSPRHKSRSNSTNIIPTSPNDRQLTAPTQATAQSSSYYNNKMGSIIILDEANANQSMEFTEFLQQTILSLYAQSTLLFIIHKLESAIELDRVMVMKPLTDEDRALGNSSVVEYDAPYVLLSNSSSYFYQMCKEYTHGNEMQFDIFYNKAKKVYYERIVEKNRIWDNAPRFLAPPTATTPLPPSFKGFTVSQQRKAQQGGNLPALLRASSNTSLDSDALFVTFPRNNAENSQPTNPNIPHLAPYENSAQNTGMIKSSSLSAFNENMDYVIDPSTEYNQSHNVVFHSPGQLPGNQSNPTTNLPFINPSSKLATAYTQLDEDNVDNGDSDFESNPFQSQK